MVLLLIARIFMKNDITPVMEEQSDKEEVMEPSSLIPLPVLEKEEEDVEIELYAYPTYHGEVSLDKVKDWVEDPSELIDNTSVSFEGKIRF